MNIKKELIKYNVTFVFVSSYKNVFKYKAEWNNMVITLRVFDYRYEFEPVEYAGSILDADYVDISVTVVKGESA